MKLWKVRGDRYRGARVLGDVEAVERKWLWRLIGPMARPAHERVLRMKTLVIAVALLTAGCVSPNEVFARRSACAQLADAVYERDQREQAKEHNSVWEMRAHYDRKRDRCYVSYRKADSIISQRVIYDAQTNQLVASGVIALNGSAGDGSGTIWLDGREDKLTFDLFERWVDGFMKDGER